MQSGQMKTAKMYEMIEVKINDDHPHAYKPHLHSELSIGIIEKGQTRLSINDEEYEFREGDAVIIMPFVVHNCQPVDLDNWAFTMIYLSDEYRDQLVEFLSPDLKIGIAKLGEKEFGLIKKLACILKEEASAFVKEVEIIDCINAIVESIDLRVSKERDETIERIRAYIEENFLKELQLDHLAQSFQLNKFKLIRRFKKLYNSTPSAYQLQLKVDFAKQLMKRESGLAEIALEAGFYDQAHFSREFKKSTGLTPKRFKQSREK